MSDPWTAKDRAEVETYARDFTMRDREGYRDALAEAVRLLDGWLGVGFTDAGLNAPTQVFLARYALPDERR